LWCGQTGRWEVKVIEVADLVRAENSVSSDLGGAEQSLTLRHCVAQ
jgi:hypothetical protein